MPFAHQRVLSVLAASLAALALGAAPALAGEDDDEDGDDSPAQVQQVPAESGSSAGPAVTPQGGVATGFGGTAAQSGPDALTLGVGGGTLLLALAGGGVAVSRRGMS